MPLDIQHNQKFQSLLDSLQAIKEKYRLTGDQTVALLEIIKSIKAKRNHVLMGYAGTGKTHLCKILNNLLDNALFTAPTNKAAQVLSKDMGVPAKTIHSTLGLVLKQGRLVQEKKPNFNNTSAVFIDESSMVDSELYEYIRREIEPHCSVIYIGDPFQLPPVNESHSQTFTTPNQSTLNEIVRQGKNNPIIAYSISLRKQGFQKDAIPFDNDHIIQGNPKMDLKEKAKLIVRTHNDGGVYAAWTNKCITAANQAAHQQIYGTGSREFEIGEKIVLNTPWIHGNETLGHIGDEFVVKGIRMKHSNDFEVWEIDVDREQPIITITSDERPKFNATLDNLATLKQWKRFFYLKEQFTEVKHTYAFTCHKLQGSSYSNVIVNSNDILKNRNQREMDRCMYVAITRTRNQVILF